MKKKSVNVLFKILLEFVYILTLTRVALNHYINHHCSLDKHLPSSVSALAFSLSGSRLTARTV